MEQFELILQKQQESSAISSENIYLNMNIINEPSHSPEPKPSPEFLLQQISEFLFDSESRITLESWFQKCESIFRIDLAHVLEHKNVRLLLRKLDTVEHKRFMNFNLPKKRLRIFPSKKQSLFFPNYLVSDVQNFGSATTASP